MTIFPEKHRPRLLALLGLACLSGTAGAQSEDEDLIQRIAAISTVSGYAWSPSGDRIVYVSNASGTGQLHLLDLDDRSSRQLTRHESAVADPQWSPDGRHLVYLTDPGWQERYEIWRYTLTDGRQERLMADVGAIQSHVRWSPDNARLLLQSNAGGDFDIAVREVTRPALRPLAAGPEGESSPEWSPDGEFILFLSRGAIWRVGTGGGEAERLFSPGLGAGLQAPSWSPDGARILFSTDQSGYWNVGVYTLATGEWRYLAPAPYEQTEPSWSPDGRRVAFITTIGFDKRVTVADLDGGETRYLTGEGAVAASPRWRPSGGGLAFLMSTPRRTQELMLHEGGETVGLTDSMAGWTPGQFQAPESHAYAAREGFDIPALLYKPVDFEPGRRYGAVIVIHGGFYGQWVHDFQALGQYLLRRGLVLFYPNPRGGGGYGRNYERLNDGDWGGGDVDDLLRAHDYLKTLDYVDGDRVAILGGSYGGYLVYALVTSAPDRFRAAVVRAGINDLRTQTTERYYAPARFNDTGGYTRQIGGRPDENPDFYRERSPIHRVDAVQTPMLIMHGLRDNRVSPSQSWTWTRALRSRGVPVTAVDYPAEDHSLLRYKDTVADQLHRISELFERHLGRTPAPAE